LIRRTDTPPVIPTATDEVLQSSQDANERVLAVRSSSSEDFLAVKDTYSTNEEEKCQPSDQRPAGQREKQRVVLGFTLVGRVCPSFERSLSGNNVLVSGCEEEKGGNKDERKSVRSILRLNQYERKNRNITNREREA